MNIVDWIKNIFKINKPKLLDAPNQLKDDKVWKDNLKIKYNQNMIVEKIMKEELRLHQIKLIESLILDKSGRVKKEEIIENIEKIYDKIILSEFDIESVISIHDIIEYEDEHGDYNIREFIEEEEMNFINLIDKMVEYAKQKAQGKEVMEIIKFIPKNRELVNEIKDEIIQESENEIVE